LYQGGWNAISAFWSRSPDLLLQYPVAGGATPPWAPRRRRWSPDIHSGLVRAAFVPIWAPSHAVSDRPSGGVVTTQHRDVSIEDAGAGGAWRVWAGRLSGWGVSNLCQPHRKAVLAFSGGFGNLPRKDCHPAGQARSWGSRWASRDPDIHSGLVGAVFLRIRAPSYVVQTGLLEGWYPSQRLGGASQNAQAKGHRWDWVAVLTQKASPGRHAHAPRHPARHSTQALLCRLATGCPQVPPPIFRWLLFYEKSRGKTV